MVKQKKTPRKRKETLTRASDKRIMVSMNDATNMVEVSGIISRETEKAVYVAQIYYIGGGGDGGGEWLPKSQLSGLVCGEAFPNHLPHRTEWRREFTATIPAWLARKVMPPRTGPVPFATRPW